jgi:hypothetical protein
VGLEAAGAGVAERGILGEPTGAAGDAIGDWRRAEHLLVSACTLQIVGSSIALVALTPYWLLSFICASN